MKVGVALVDLLVGLHATIGILASLHDVRDTGRGRLVEVNLLSSLLSSLANQGSAYAIAGLVPERMGNLHPSIAPYELFEAADRQVAIACGTDKQFESLCRVIDREDLAADPRYGTNRDRVQNRHDLRVELEKAFAERGSDLLLAELEAVGVPAGPVNSIAEAFRLAEELGLEPVQQVSGPLGSVPQLTNPLSFDGDRLPIRSAPPRLGEHTEEVLEWLHSANPPSRDAAGPESERREG